jgi:hypothetical protein
VFRNKDLRVFGLFLLLGARFVAISLSSPVGRIQNIKEHLLLNAEDLTASGSGDTLRLHDPGMILA